MTKFFYHVCYYSKGKKDDQLGDCIINTIKPITDAEDINFLRQCIAGSTESTVVIILGFTLLRTEEVEP